MVEKLVKAGRLDNWALALSGLCFAHCLLTAAILTAVAATGFSPFLANPVFHEIGLALAIALGFVALGFGLRSHGRVGPAAVGAIGLSLMATALYVGHGGWEIVLTMLGVSALAIAHIWNRRANQA